MTKTRFFMLIGALAILTLLIALHYAGKAAIVGAGYKAKIACSEVFVAGRDPARVADDEFHGISPLFEHINLEIDEDKRETRASLYGLGASRAVYRSGYGCTLARGGDPASLPELSPIDPKPLPTAINQDVQAILNNAMSDPGAGHRAIVVVRQGVVIAEAYAEGFDAATPMLSWSMAKSVTATMVGLAIREDLIRADQSAGVPEWSKPGDPRAAITWIDILEMQDGLDFEENYASPFSDVNQMLFGTRDTGSVAAAKKLAHEPGAHWSYSSGTTNLIQRTLRGALEARGVNYHSFLRDRVLEPLGAASVVIEPDASGTFIGSSFVYATPRDWARLGLVYLNDGVWNGKRLLPGGWSASVAQPAVDSDNWYGKQFWLNREGKDGRSRYVPGLPEDAYQMAGHEGQYVTIVPDKELVIVRLGMSRGIEPMTVVAPVFGDIYAAID